MKKLSVSLSNHKTSISLEKEFIDLLNKIADSEKTSVSAIINKIDKIRRPDSNLSSEIRIYLLNKVMQTAKL